MRTVFRNSEIPGRVYALQPFLSAGKINGWLQVWEGCSGPADSFGHLPHKYHSSARQSVYTVYSYGTPIAWVTENEDQSPGSDTLLFHVPDISYSLTTGQQQLAVREAWSAALRRQGLYPLRPGRGREGIRVPGPAEAYGQERRARSGGLDGVRPGGVVGRRSAYEDTGDDAAHMDGGLSAQWAGHPAHP